MATAYVPAFGPRAMPLMHGALSVAVVAALAWPPVPRTSDMLGSALGPIWAAASMTTAEGPRPRDIARQVSSEALPNVPGKRLTVVKVTYAPGGYTPPHHHAGSVLVYILAGTIHSQLAGGPIETFEAGESFFEPPGAVHLVSENASLTEPAELLAVFVADEGATLTTYHE